MREARHGDRVVPGRVLIAPGGRAMLLKRSGAQYGRMVDAAGQPSPAVGGCPVPVGGPFCRP